MITRSSPVITLNKSEKIIQFVVVCRLEIMLILIFLSIILIHKIDGYKILTVSPTPFKSHWKIGASIAKELAKVGHEVTFVSPYEMKFNNVENIVLERDKVAYSNAFDLLFVGPLVNFQMLPVFTAADVNFTLSHPKVQKLLAKNEKFDAVIVEIFAADALYGKRNINF